MILATNVMTNELTLYNSSVAREVKGCINVLGTIFAKGYEDKLFMLIYVLLTNMRIYVCECEQHTSEVIHSHTAHLKFVIV